MILYVEVWEGNNYRYMIIYERKSKYCILFIFVWAGVRVVQISKIPNYLFGLKYTANNLIVCSLRANTRQRSFIIINMHLK